MSEPVCIEFPCFVIDTETCGLPSDEKADVVEVAAVYIDHQGQIRSSWSSLVFSNHCRHDSAGVRDSMAINTIDLNQIDTAPTAKDVDGALWQWMNITNRHAPWTSWRLDFDYTMLLRTFKRVPTIRRTDCIWEAARHVYGSDEGDARFPRLKQAATLTGLTIESTQHRALPDAVMAARLAHVIEKQRQACMEMLAPHGLRKAANAMLSSEPPGVRP